MIEIFFDRLIEWYLAHGRHTLAWRNYHYPIKDLTYRIYLSEILLQQTQVSRVEGYFARMTERFPDIESLSGVLWEDFFAYYDGLGYYSRGKNILKTAKKVVDDFGAIFPSDTILLQSLPGVGPYTAEAIRSFAFGIQTLSWDTNVEQIMRRLIKGSRQIPLDPADIGLVKEYVFVSKYSSRDINNALMDYGSLTNKKSYDVIRALDLDFGIGLFSQQKGQSEVKIQKIRQIFPTRDAQIRAIVHQDHRQYFCPNIGGFWQVPPVAMSDQGDVRSCVKDFFLKNHGVLVSVRPVHRRYYEQDIPFVEVNVQVQSGQLSANICSRGEFLSRVNFVGK